MRHYDHHRARFLRCDTAYLLLPFIEMIRENIMKKDKSFILPY